MNGGRFCDRGLRFPFGTKGRPVQLNLGRPIELLARLVTVAPVLFASIDYRLVVAVTLAVRSLVAAFPAGGYATGATTPLPLGTSLRLMLRTVGRNALFHTLCRALPSTGFFLGPVPGAFVLRFLVAGLALVRAVQVHDAATEGCAGLRQ